MKSRKLMLLPALLTFTMTAFAGFTQPASVIIQIDPNDGSGFAQGDMLTARNSKNDNEFIGCGVRKTEDGAGVVFTWGFCQASLEEGATVTCFTTNAALLEGVDMLNDSSFITFSWTDDGAENLTCTRIGSSSQSFYLPEGKSNKESE